MPLTYQLNVELCTASLHSADMLEAPAMLAQVLFSRDKIHTKLITKWSNRWLLYFCLDFDFDLTLI